MKRPTPDTRAGKLLVAGALLLVASCALVVFTAALAAARAGTVTLVGASLEKVLPAHAVEVEMGPAGLRVVTTGEPLERFARRLDELQAAGIPAPAAILRLDENFSMKALAEALSRLEQAGFDGVYVALSPAR